MENKIAETNKAQVRKNFDLKSGVRELSYIPFANEKVFDILFELENEWSKTVLELERCNCILFHYETALHYLQNHPEEIHVNLNFDVPKHIQIPNHPRDVSKCRKAINQYRNDTKQMTTDIQRVYVQTLVEICKNIASLCEEPLAIGKAIFIGEGEFTKSNNLSAEDNDIREDINNVKEDTFNDFDIFNKAVLHPMNDINTIANKIAGVVCWHLFNKGHTKTLGLRTL